MPPPVTVLPKVRLADAVFLPHPTMGHCSQEAPGTHTRLWRFQASQWLRWCPVRPRALLWLLSAFQDSGHTGVYLERKQHWGKVNKISLFTLPQTGDY